MKKQEKRRLEKKLRDKVKELEFNQAKRKHLRAEDLIDFKSF